MSWPGKWLVCLLLTLMVSACAVCLASGETDGCCNDIGCALCEQGALAANTTAAARVSLSNVSCTWVVFPEPATPDLVRFFPPPKS